MTEQPTGDQRSVVGIRIEHSPTGEREDRRMRAIGVWDLSNGPYAYRADDLLVEVTAAEPAAPAEADL